MTEDPASRAPTEIAGLVPSTGGAVPPNVVAPASPGLSTAAAKPPIAPTLPDPTDPQAMALLFARVANELFGGASVVPAPSPASMATAQGAASPASPGVSPTAAMNAPTGAGGPSDPTALALPNELVTMPAIGTPVSSSSASFPTSSAPGQPAIPTTSRGTLAQSATQPANAQPPATTASTNPSAGSTSTTPFGGSPFGATTVESMFGGTPVLGGDNPFAATTFDNVPGFESTRIPMFDAIAPDAAPYFVPDANHLPIEPAPSDFELRGDDPLIRDLGRVAFDPHAVRRDFPILEERIHGKRLVWLDNAATTQKPRAVIDRISYYYERENSNVHRGAHTLAARATDAYEAARETTRRFLNAPSTKEIIWVRGATEGINLIAQSWGRRFVNAGDEIVITHLEHHANIVPWQMLCAEKGARLRIAPVDDRGDVILEEYDKLINPKTRLVAFPQVSNALGTITPAREMVEMAHRHGARVLVDGAQAVSHMPVDVQLLDCDFYVFSGHKVFAPTGIGVVYGKREILEQMPPWQGGGNMIQDVTFERSTYQPPPGRFEAGTGSIADAVGLGAALDYVMRIGMDVIDRYEHGLLVYGTERLMTVPGLTMIGTSPNKAGVLSFVLDGQRTEDVGAALDKYGIAVRSGHHCAQPIHRRFGLEGTIRASLAFYNVCEDIDALVDALRQLQGPRPF